VASRSLGTLTVDLIAKIGGFTRGLSEAERKADRTARDIARKQKALAKEIDAAAKGIGVAFGAAVAGLGVAFAVLDRQIKNAAVFKDLEETTGASAEGLASMAVAAETAGVAMDSIAANSIRLTKGLVGVDDESKAAGAAISALGLNLKDFKSLDPVAQFDVLTQAFGNFADGPEKAAAATAIFGKSGAEMLKVFKALEEQGGRTKILTQEQIEQADAYADAQAKATAELKLYIQAASTEAAPAFIELTRVTSDFIKELIGAGKEANKLGQSSAIQEFARSAAIAVASLIDQLKRAGLDIKAFGKSTQQEFKAIEFGLKFLRSSPADIGDFFRGKPGELATLKKELSQLTDEAAKAGKAAADAASGPGVADALRKRFDLKDLQSQVKGLADQAGLADLEKLLAKPRPKVNYQGVTKDAKSAKDEVDEVAKALEEVVEQLALFGQSDAFSKAFKLQALDATNEQIEEYRANLEELERLKIADEIEQTIDAIVKERDEFGLTNEELTIHRLVLKGASAEQIKYAQDVLDATRAIREQQDALAARQAAQAEFDRTSRQRQRELEGYGLGRQARDRNSGVSSIEDRFADQRRQIENQRELLRAQNQLTSDAEKQFQTRLDLNKEFLDKELADFNANYDARLKIQQSFTLGLRESLQNYVDDAKNIAAQVEGLFDSALRGTEDAITRLITTGKGGFKELLNSIATDAVRIGVRQTMAQAIEGLGLGSIFGKQNSGSGADRLAQGIDPAVAALQRFTLALDNISNKAAVQPSGEQSIMDLFKEPDTEASELGDTFADTRTAAETFADILGPATGAIASLGKAGGVAGQALSLLPTILSAFGGAKGVGDFFGGVASFFGGFFANGGNPPLGKVSVVGENGPELFVPRQSGTIIPLSKVEPAASERPVYVNLTQQFAPGTNRQTTDQAAVSAGRVLQRAAVRGTV
jgi:lambda family phage tail tape measure protein